MKKYILSICALFAYSVSASAITVDFNSETLGGSALGYSDQGVSFTNTGTSFWGTSPNSTTAMAISGANAYATASFSTATSVSVDLGDYNADADTLFLSIFDSSNNLIDTITQDIASTFTGMVTLSLAGADISYATFGTIGGLGGIYADNFTVNPVPVPAAAWLFGSALLGFFGYSRRKQQA